LRKKEEAGDKLTDRAKYLTLGCGSLSKLNMESQTVLHLNTDMMNVGISEQKRMRERLRR
jgi:hypothetical protein